MVVNTFFCFVLNWQLSDMNIRVCFHAVVCFDDLNTSDLCVEINHVFPYFCELLCKFFLPIFSQKFSVCFFIKFSLGDTVLSDKCIFS